MKPYAILMLATMLAPGCFGGPVEKPHRECQVSADQLTPSLGANDDGPTLAELRAQGANKPPRPMVYIMKPGDTSDAVAHEYGMTTDELAQLNPSLNDVAKPRCEKLPLERRLQDLRHSGPYCNANLEEAGADGGDLTGINSPQAGDVLIVRAP